MRSYYERKRTEYFDGTSIFQNEEDRKSEEETAQIISAVFGCNVQRFGVFSPVDWYAEDKDGQPLGMLELKTRNHKFGTYPTVFLNLRKWNSLVLSYLYTGVQPTFVVRFLDGIYWIPVFEIDARALRRGGCKKLVKSHNDVEPVIEVPISELRELQVFAEHNGVFHDPN